MVGWERWLVKVSPDCQAGNADVEVDSQTLNTVIKVEKLSGDEQSQIFKVIDAPIRDARLNRLMLHEKSPDGSGWISSIELKKRFRKAV